MELSLRLLPRPLREPLGLAYLLARASDTIADSGRMESRDRILILEEIRCTLAEAPTGGLRSVKYPGELPAVEQGLLEALPGLFALMGELPDRGELIMLWGEILEGQLVDLRRFTPGSAPMDHSELELYCDLVAGSVGRCWTRLISRHAPSALRVPVSELLSPATEYGKGLQLLNILRDRESDRVIGRHYVSEVDLTGHLELVRKWLKGGDAYLRGLTPGRILMASALPLDLAKATIPLVAAAPPGSRARLSRSVVRRTLAAGTLSLVLPRRPDPV